MDATSVATVADHLGPAADDGALRRLVAGQQTGGWDSPAGRDLLRAIEAHCSGWAAAVDRRCGLPTGTTEPADLLTVAWHVVTRFGGRIGAAEASWAYLWTAVRNAASVDATAVALQSTRAAVRDMQRCRTLSAPVRIGLEHAMLDGQVPRDDVYPAAPISDQWSTGLQALLDLIVRRGGDRSFWADAIDRAVDVMADARRSYEEHNLRRDPYLRLVLGLHPDQLSALGALLVGTRRGDRASQSLLLALRRDARADPAAVPGATSRLDALTGAARPGSQQADDGVARHEPGVA